MCQTSQNTIYLDYIACAWTCVWHHKIKSHTVFTRPSHVNFELRVTPLEYFTLDFLRYEMLVDAPKKPTLYYAWPKPKVHGGRLTTIESLSETCIMAGNYRPSTIYFQVSRDLPLRRKCQLIVFVSHLWDIRKRPVFGGL